jgi:hypothetical protein
MSKLSYAKYFTSFPRRRESSSFQAYFWMPVSSTSMTQVCWLDFRTVVLNDRLDKTPEYLLSLSQPISNDKTSIDSINYAKSLYTGDLK